MGSSTRRLLHSFLPLCVNTQPTCLCHPFDAVCLLLLHAGHIIRTPVTSPVPSSNTRKYGSASIALRLKIWQERQVGRWWWTYHLIISGTKSTGSRQVLKRKTRHLQQWGSRKLPGIGLKYAQMASTALTLSLIHI